MKIEPTRPTGASSPSRRTGGVDGAGFTLPTDGPRAAAAAAPTAAVTGMDALMALQMDDPGKRKRQARRGAAQLDTLDRLQAALLSGEAGAADVAALADQLAAREPTGDAGLDDTLREIDVRAAVELAKRERRGARHA